MKIICIGRNYVAHAQELNNAIPTEPVIFIKPQTALLKNNEDFYYPELSKDIHYECEVVFRIGKSGKHIAEKFAHQYIDGIGLGIDFTARDLQEKQKQKGLPWEIAKAFDNSAVIGKFKNTEGVDLDNIDFKLLLNENIVQESNNNLCLFSIAKIIAYTSQFFTLQQGDLIFTGTPEGVGPVKIGDNLKGFLQGEEWFNFWVK
jgi:2-keto-4-pentenoate hydratase/2-oxohepta-3-ene-1,7-dioic acid hydratase in catechol pathway